MSSSSLTHIRLTAMLDGRCHGRRLRIFKALLGSLWPKGRSAPHVKRGLLKGRESRKIAVAVVSMPNGGRN